MEEENPSTQMTVDQTPWSYTCVTGEKMVSGTWYFFAFMSDMFQKDGLHLKSNCTHLTVEKYCKYTSEPWQWRHSTWKGHKYSVGILTKDTYRSNRLHPGTKIQYRRDIWADWCFCYPLSQRCLAKLCKCAFPMSRWCKPSLCKTATLMLRLFKGCQRGPVWAAGSFRCSCFSGTTTGPLVLFVFVPLLHNGWKCWI